MQKDSKTGVFWKRLDLDLGNRSEAFVTGVEFYPLSMTCGACGPTCRWLGKGRKRWGLFGPRGLEPGIGRVRNRGASHWATAGILSRKGM